MRNKKIIIIDLNADRMGNHLSGLIDGGAFPPQIGRMLKGIMPDIFPFEGGCPREMWPGVGFPVGDPIHAILNHLYASTQRDIVPSHILDSIRQEASDVMDCEPDFDDETKAMILKGSTKRYNRVLPDGTEISIEVKKPVKEDDDGLDDIVGIMDKKKTAALRRGVHSYGVDADKLCRAMYHASITEPSIEKHIGDIVKKAIATSVRLNFLENEKLLSGVIKKVADATGLSEENVLSDVEADEETDDKLMIHGYLLDRAKFTEYPFDSLENAKKACGHQVTDVICDKTTGNVVESKLVSLDNYAKEDPLAGRILDQVASILKYEG